MGTKKVSLTLDERNVAEARRIVGERQFSRLVNSALAHELQRIRIAQFAADADREHGPVLDQVRREVEATGLRTDRIAGCNIEVRREGGRVHVGGATIVEADVPAENGIIHVVDGFVWLPEG